MLRAKENRQLTQVGPGTFMGELFRRYWHPIATAQDMHTAPTKPVRLLGEDFTLYKDKRGRLGLLARRCAHRGVDLKWGIPEEDGLRCPYHGWLYDATGQCVEMPAEPKTSTFPSRTKIGGHPVQELNGLIFAYIGPEPAPLIPRWNVLVEDGLYRMIGWVVLECNWLQCQENSVDPVHAEFLHGHFNRFVLKQLGIDESESEQLPRFLRHHEQFGFTRFEHGIIKRRLQAGDPEDVSTWRVGHPLVFPNALLNGGPGRRTMQFRVPVDDARTWVVSYTAYTLEHGVPVPAQDPVPAYEVPFTDAQLPTSVGSQDYLAWIAQGPIADRTEERLGESDTGLIMFRKMLIEQATIVQDGGDPMNTFRDPAANQCLQLTVDRYREDLRGYKRGAVLSSSNSARQFSPLGKDLDDLLSISAELATQRLGPAPSRPKGEGSVW